jgi:hypothetical protein
MVQCIREIVFTTTQHACTTTKNKNKFYGKVFHFINNAILKSSKSFLNPLNYFTFLTARHKVAFVSWWFSLKALFSSLQKTRFYMVLFVFLFYVFINLISSPKIYIELGQTQQNGSRQRW